MSATTHDASTPRNPVPIIAVAAFAAFLATFNETFLNIGFTPIMVDLHVDVTTVQWLAGAYMLGAGVMVPVSAFLYRSIPTRPLFLAIVALLMIGSVVGGLAPNFPVLLIGRIIQSLGTGLLIPVGMNITLDVAPRQKLGICMGLMGAMTTLGPSLSIVIAGALLSVFNDNWHTLLWTFAGLSTLCFIFGAVMLRDVSKLTHPKLDAASVALIALALVGILYGVSTLFDASVNLLVSFAAIVIGAIALILFVRRQKGLEHPLIDLRALLVRPFALGVIMNMIALIIMFAMNIIIPVFLQGALGESALNASFVLFPAIILAVVVAPIAGRIYDKHGVKLLLPLGFAMTAIAVVLLSFCIRTESLILMAFLYIFVIAGSALIIGPVQSFALSRLTPELNAHGVTIMSTGFQIAGCIGASVFSGIYAVATGFAAASGSAQGVAAGANEGFVVVGLISGVISVVGLVLAFRISAYKRREQASVAAPSVLSQIAKREVYTLNPNDKVLDALRSFVDKGVSGMPVVSDTGAIVGFVSDGDIMRYLADQHPAFKTAYSFIVEGGNEGFDEKLTSLVQLPVSEIATKHVISVDLGMDLGEICSVLVEHHLKKAPVLENGKMVGIINRSNIVRYSVTDYL
ncbi:MAG: MFS transporter, partial [Coriobacteriales bacterium]|nr:MFS transporter [Coriobacteriales bacterium]